ncbi:LpxL/LpxP family Kdo(2)-lipid IV(A) lauroyl/palmitoleoyl acyltransferase [Echinimonas agarilytica]|uniref:Lipid A biosynthesis acyltransferase n=1 Tax=Echinimonas agarilytica TaxID=1215918 RepID=A0AA41W8G4_9GAMM|nr:LpxL/LpxP family Kdo(2)-lipid IV(A) lauroyl/palmitoleoyl acyltransferase [Echinimonas agarilytica]MCM2680388.1 LpxL/LpxP family Kdo(2)-lipid IV(A) lauroyl/palmitoleoyl acyltransferase [Echinimonas agarilytica]
MPNKSPGDFQLKMLHPKYWPIWCGYGVLWLIVQMPFRWIIQFGLGVGWLAGRILKSRRHVAATNIRLCFPELSVQEQHQLVEQNLKEAGVSLMETGIAWFWSRKRILQLIDFEGDEHIQNALNNNKGMLMLACHMMNLEVGCRMFAELHHANGLYRPNKNLVLEYFQYNGRSRTGAGMLDRNNIRAAFRALKKGERLWYAPDQDLGPRRSIFVPFFGIEDTATTPAAGPLADKGNAVVVPFMQYRKADNSGYKMVLQAPLENFPAGDEIVDTTRINAVIEQNIRQCPSQYLWVHRRFKTRPERSMPSRY